MLKDFFVPLDCFRILQRQAPPLEESESVRQLAPSDVSNQEVVSILRSDSTERTDYLRVLALLFGVLFDVVKSKFFNLRVPNDLHVVDFGAIRLDSILQSFHHLGFQLVIGLLHQLSEQE